MNYIDETFIRLVQEQADLDRRNRKAAQYSSKIHKHRINYATILALISYIGWAYILIDAFVYKLH